MSDKMAERDRSQEWDNRAPAELMEVHSAASYTLLFMQLLHHSMTHEGKETQANEPFFAAWVVGLIWRELHEGESLLQPVAEAFGAVASDAKPYGGFIASSMHELVFNMASDFIGGIISDMKSEIDDEDDVEMWLRGLASPGDDHLMEQYMLTIMGSGAESEQAKMLKQEFESRCKDEMRRSGQHHVFMDCLRTNLARLPLLEHGREIRVALEQELFRAWKQKCPLGSLSYETWADRQKERIEEFYLWLRSAAAADVLLQKGIEVLEQMRITDTQPTDGSIAEDLPPKAGWDFVPGKASYNERETLVQGIPRKLLEALAGARRPLTTQELLAAGWPNDSTVDEKTLRTHLSNLRKTLRQALSLDKKSDPIPCRDRGANAAWELHPDLRQRR